MLFLQFFEDIIHLNLSSPRSLFLLDHPSDNLHSVLHHATSVIRSPQEYFAYVDLNSLNVRTYDEPDFGLLTPFHISYIEI